MRSNRSDWRRTGSHEGMNLAVIDWTPVIVAALTLAGVIFTGLCQVGLYLYIRPPSSARFGFRGGSLGRMIEETHANSGVTTAAVAGLEEDTNGKTTHPPAYTAGTPPSER